MNTVELHRCIIANNPIQVLNNLKSLGISVPEDATADDILDAVYEKADSLGCVDGVNQVIVPAFTIQFDHTGACAEELADYMVNSLPVLLKANGHDCNGNTELVSPQMLRYHRICQWMAIGFIVLVILLVLKSLFK